MGEKFELDMDMILDAVQEHIDGMEINMLIHKDAGSTEYTVIAPGNEAHAFFFYLNAFDYMYSEMLKMMKRYGMDEEKKYILLDEMLEAVRNSIIKKEMGETSDDGAKGMD